MTSSFSNNLTKIILITSKNHTNKGVETSSIGLLIKANEYHVTIIKIDPCFNYNSAMLDQSKYGEQYVFDDGDIAPLNFGIFQRFLNQTFTTKHNLTNGKISEFILNDERKGLYNAFNKALKNIKRDKKEFMHIHISQITRSDPDSVLTDVQNWRNKGWNPDLIICKSKHKISEDVKEKIATHSSLQPQQIIYLIETDNINQVPLLLQQQNIYPLIADKLELEHRPNLNIVMHWSNIVKMSDSYKRTVKVAIVGKYLKHELFPKDQIFRDSYSSVINALNDAGIWYCKVDINFVWAKDLEVTGEKRCAEKRRAAFKLLEEAHGIVITAGFDIPGFQGMIEACKYAREKKKPLLSICNGMQYAVIEFAQNVCEIKDATSKKLWNAQNKNNQLPPFKKEQEVIIRMFENFGEKSEMRLGRRTTTFITEDSKVFNDYGKKDSIQQRHRHGYEVNPEFVPRLIAKGLRFVGMGVDERFNGKSESFPESSQKLLNIAQNEKVHYKGSTRSVFRVFA
uniref:CTP synthase n=1 Tax=Panagrolaimus davidi TaxID=227884 RepID=A0A914P737_9BILA